MKPSKPQLICHVRQYTLCTHFSVAWQLLSSKCEIVTKKQIEMPKPHAHPETIRKPAKFQNDLWKTVVGVEHTRTYSIELLMRKSGSLWKVKIITCTSTYHDGEAAKFHRVIHKSYKYRRRCAHRAPTDSEKRQICKARQVVSRK